MHDLDRTLRTYDSEAYETQWEDREFTGEMSQEQELELAHELLTLSGEAELEEFFKKLLKGAGKFIKPLAKTLLPIAGKVAGGFFGGPIGAQIGGKLGSMATKLFEVDETLPEAEQELEVAKQFVRLACVAAKNAGSAPPYADPMRVARGAVMQAAREYAPGLIRPVSRRPMSGRWIRSGNRLQILGAF
jgi:uncharacterized protein (DUF697 family)